MCEWFAFTFEFQYSLNVGIQSSLKLFIMFLKTTYTLKRIDFILLKKINNVLQVKVVF